MSWKKRMLCCGQQGAKPLYALSAIGMKRQVMASVDSFSAALALACGSNLIATVPDKQTIALREGMHAFAVPIDTQEFTASLLWHPRQDGDPADRWLRGCVRGSELRAK